MKLTILIDNYTISGGCYGAESGFSAWFEDRDKKVLLDAGRSDMFMKNAWRRGIDCLQADAVVLSHGHYDHTWGLLPLVQAHIEATYEKRPRIAAPVYAHPDTFLPKEAGGKNIGSILNEASLHAILPVHTTKEPVWLTDRLVFLSEIERTNDFEAKKPLGHTLRNGVWEDDYLYDDSAMVYCSDKGLVIVTPCAHAGVCNTIAYAKKVCHTDTVYAVIGGFHLLRDNPDVMRETLDFIEDCQPELVYPCHCVSLENKTLLARELPVKELGAGTRLRFDE